MQDTTSAPLHQRILADIEQRILSGEWPPGHRIPFEHELTAQYGCSRMTVNKVLTQLASAGLIERRRKVGSFVRKPVTQSAVLQIQGIESEVRALGLPYRFEVVRRRRRKAGRADRDILDFPAGGSVLELECRHFAGPRVFCHEERLICLDSVPEAAHEAFAELAPGAWLVEKVPWTVAEHRIRSVGADERMAASFSVAPATPCLEIERRTWRAERPVTFARLTYRGDAHELVARFAPS